MDYTGAKDDGNGGDIWRYKIREMDTANQPTPSFLQAMTPFLSPNQQYQGHSTQINVVHVSQLTVAPFGIKYPPTSVSFNVACDIASGPTVL